MAVQDARLAYRHGHQAHRCTIGLQHIPAAVGDDGGKRLVPFQKHIDGALGVGDFRCRQIALAILRSPTGLPCVGVCLARVSMRGLCEGATAK